MNWSNRMTFDFSLSLITPFLLDKVKYKEDKETDNKHK